MTVKQSGAIWSSFDRFVEVQWLKNKGGEKMYAKLEPYENTWIYLPLSTILILHHFQLFGLTCMYLIGLSRLCDLSFICFDGPPVVDHQPFFYSIRLLIVAFYQMGVWSVYFRTSEAFFCASNFKVPSKYLEVPQTVKCKGEGAGDVTASVNLRGVEFWQVLQIPGQPVMAISIALMHV